MQSRKHGIEISRRETTRRESGLHWHGNIHEKERVTLHNIRGLESCWTSFLLKQVESKKISNLVFGQEWMSSTSDSHIFVPIKHASHGFSKPAIITQSVFCMYVTLLYIHAYNYRQMMQNCGISPMGASDCYNQVFHPYSPRIGKCTITHVVSHSWDKSRSLTLYLEFNMLRKNA